MQEQLQTAFFFIESLLGIEVAALDDEAARARFCARCRFSPAQQVTEPDFLSAFLGELEPTGICELVDCLATCYVFVRLDGRSVALGPFVQHPLAERDCEEALAAAKLPQTMLGPFKLYHCSLPVLPMGKVTAGAYALVHHVLGADRYAAHQKRRLGAAATATLPTPTLSYEALTKLVGERYETEKKMMLEIENGNFAEAFRYSELILQQTAHPSHVDSDIKQEFYGSLIFFTLARIAVERAGVPPILIDTLSQEHAQRVRAADTPAAVRAQRQLLLSDLCNLVREHKVSQYSAHVGKAISLLSLNLSAPLSVKGIAAEIGVSPNYLSSIFRRETGMTLKQYITQKRMEKAAALLRYSMLSVQDICDYIGVGDNNYFSKQFKQCYALSPTQFRRQAGTMANG